MMINPVYRAQVDLLLRVLPFDDRNTALANIEFALRRIKKRIEESKLGIHVISIAIAGNDAKLSCQLEQTKIIIEANTTIRRHLFEPRVFWDDFRAL